jgi:hypothetical protein
MLDQDVILPSISTHDSGHYGGEPLEFFVASPQENQCDSSNISVYTSLATYYKLRPHSRMPRDEGPIPATIVN